MSNDQQRGLPSSMGTFSVQLVNVGFGNMVSSLRMVAVVSPDSAPIKRMIQDARDAGRVIDATCGRKTRAVVVMDSDHIVLSPLQPETLAGRMAGKVKAAEEDSSQLEEDEQ